MDAQTETTALAVREDAYTGKALLTKEVLRQEAEQRALVAEYVKRQMREGTDYGTIPGTPKPTLLKPGAEKLVDLFRCTPDFKVVEKTQDWERGFFNFIFKCSICQRDTGAVLAVGFGSANSYESRYRWRDGKRKCPDCGSEALLLSKQKSEWFCWAKKGGCGAVFAKADKRVTEQQVGRVENPDLPDMANTVLKMAKKRALVDASIALARCSDMFTQDVEDFAHEAPPEDVAPPAPAPQPQRQAPPPASGAVRAPATAVAREAQRVADAVGGQVQETRPARVPEVRFGALKGMPLSTLTDAQLSETLDAGNETLVSGKAPNGKALTAGAKHALQEAVLELEAEVERRIASKRNSEGLPVSREPGEDDGDVPF